MEPELARAERPDKPLSIGERIVISGRVVWADRDSVLIDLEGSPSRIARIKLELAFVRRRASAAM
jgi:hypothetical protein